MVRSNIANAKKKCLWCDFCGTIVLGKKCICGNNPREFEINSPGDIRPCIGESTDLILSLFKKEFGTDTPLRGKMIFLNKVPGDDRVDEIIAHGAVIGIIKFDLIKKCFSIELRQSGAKIFNSYASKNIITLGSIPGHLKGKLVAGKDIKDVVGDFEEGSYAIIRKGEKVGVGVVLGNSSSLKEMKKAVKIRDIGDNKNILLSPNSDREHFVRSNRKYLKKIESDAIHNIKSFIDQKKTPITISFSGGKDSLAAYGVASKALKTKIDLLFVDTGLEFPETVEYVKNFVRKNNLRLHEAQANNAFHNNVDIFGPPAKDFRWCCKVCKLGPMTDMISKDYPNGTITVEGNRMMESFTRLKIGFISSNPFVPNQTILNPVRTWNASEIWGYIWMNELEYNPLYEKDFERIGCYLCASCLASEWKNTERIHPELYRDWINYLYKYADRHGLSKEFVDMEFWRWKVLPPKMINFAKNINLKIKPISTEEPSIKMLKGASSCASGGFSVEAIVNISRVRNFSAVKYALKTIGDVRYSDEFEVALLKNGNTTVKMFGGGQISVISKSFEDAKLMFERAVKALLRSQMCTSCGICAKKCPKHAITINNGLHVNFNKCVSCGKCETSCMIVHYYNKIIVNR
ncbi:MAG: phosphoadenosine phosphosulfate reductase family protein [archaeon]|nr:phosphoadenosine phosphosulfate reductase family protein [archaeon]